jgi:hypothetical protein
MAERGSCPRSDPVVVFGTGGSGTRAVAAFLSACGIPMGQNVNRMLDAREFRSVLTTHIGRTVRNTRSLDYDPQEIPPRLLRQFVAECHRAANRHIQGISPSSPWGIKEPRIIFVLPLINSAFPEARFVHVVRDGRDMLLSRNRNQPTRYFEEIFDRAYEGNKSDIGEFWAKTNSEARAFGKRCLKQRYVVFRIEDACGENREKKLAAIAGFVGVERKLAMDHAGVFEPQPSFGRRRQLSMRYPDEFRAALTLFRYI